MQRLRLSFQMAAWHWTTYPNDDGDLLWSNGIIQIDMKTRMTAIGLGIGKWYWIIRCGGDIFPPLEGHRCPTRGVKTRWQGNVARTAVERGACISVAIIH